MSMQTPRNYQKKSNYTSPIGLLKNYNAINAPNNTNSYQQQFFRIKAQRLQAELDELKQQNAHLKSKLTDITAANQALREKIFVIQNNLDRERSSSTRRTIPSFITDSGYPSGNRSGRQGSPSMMDQKYFSLSMPNQKTERSAYNSEIQRLAKQNRILKNQHQVQMTKLRDENKKLIRKNIELQENIPKKLQQNQSMEDKSYKQKQEQRLLKLQKVNNDLRKDNQQFQKQKRRLEQKLRNTQQTNKNLKKQNQQLKVLQLSNGRNDQTIQVLKSQVQKKQKQYIQRVSSLQKQIQSLKINVNSQQSLREIQNIDNEKTSRNQTGKLEKQNQILKRKITLHQQNLNDKEQQIKGILTKLKPLLDKQKVNKKQGQQIAGEKRASLSILEIFLKKYKINSF